MIHAIPVPPTPFLSPHCRSPCLPIPVSSFFLLLHRFSHLLAHLPLVLADPVEVVPTDDEGAVHLGGDDNALDDPTTDGHVACTTIIFLSADYAYPQSHLTHTQTPDPYQELEPTSERALLVDIGASPGLLGRLEAEANVLGPAGALTETIATHVTWKATSISQLSYS